MGKKNRNSAEAAAPPFASSSNSRLMENLKTVNFHLVKEATLCRKQIEKLQSQISSMAADNDIFHEIKRDVFNLVLSSSLSEAAERRTAEMAAVSDTERNLINKTESALEEVNAAETGLLALVRDKDAKVKELAELKESHRSMEVARERGKRWRKWVYPAAGLFVLVGDKDEREKQLAELKESHRSMKQAREGGKRWRKWIYPAAGLLALVGEKDEKKEELAELKESHRSMEQARELEISWRKWAYPAAATATCIAAACALFTFCTSSKK